MDTIHVIREYYPGILETEYHAEEGTRTDVMLERIAETRHLLKENNTLDMDRAASVFLHELRRGKLGRLSLEWINNDETEKSLSE